MARRHTRTIVRICSRQRAVRVPRKRIVELVGFIAATERVCLADVDVAVVDDREMARLNRRFRRRRRTTDVLSFDLADTSEEPVIAQLIVSGPQAVRHARRRSAGVQRELMLYVVHGLLHLMGYDDARPADAAAMAARQEELLDEFLSCGR